MNTLMLRSYLHNQGRCHGNLADRHICYCSRLLHIQH